MDSSTLPDWIENNRRDSIRAALNRLFWEEVQSRYVESKGALEHDQLGDLLKIYVQGQDGGDIITLICEIVAINNKLTHHGGTP